MRILVLPGDGIGPEITAATTEVLTAVSQRFDLGLDLIEDSVGHDSFRRYGTTIRLDILDQARAAQGVILGPAATFDFKDESKGEINPSKFLRKSLDLYANVRPAKTYDGFRGRIGQFDLVVVRENTEGFYADRNMELGHAELLVSIPIS
jgi:3-isopropylmalate dehydrogenase